MLPMILEVVEGFAGIAALAAVTSKVEDYLIAKNVISHPLGDDMVTSDCPTPRLPIYREEIYPPGFMPTAFWNLADWGDERHPRDGGTPFWMREPLAAPAVPIDEPTRVPPSQGGSGKIDPVREIYLGICSSCGHDKVSMMGSHTRGSAYCSYCHESFVWENGTLVDRIFGKTERWQ